MIRDTKRLAAVALFVSLSVLGSLLKLPTHIGSIALDSTPALVAGALLGRKEGALVAAVGHLSSAWLGGFQLGPLHWFIALEMGVLVYSFSLLFQLGWRKTAYFFFFIGNTFLAPLPFIFVMGSAFVIALFPPLAAGTIANVAASFVVVSALLRLGIFKQRKINDA
ncbi:ECF transporter S component [Anoxybacteroides tepidamans]|uniref:ECF transporter S component n=1 Tax=Anoxybacteroides tepidamans TaxID=265948 RepID=UPI000481C1E3|nr:ECF transporter S component [Anoxybacillus tepidamans]